MSEKNKSFNKRLWVLASTNLAINYLALTAWRIWLAHSASTIAPAVDTFNEFPIPYIEM